MAAPPSAQTDSAIEAVLREAWGSGHGVVWNDSIMSAIASEHGIEPAKMESHRMWAETHAPWLSRSRVIKDSIEVLPHGGWLFRPPGPVPVSTHAYRVTEYGPEDFSKLEGSGGLTFQHKKLGVNEFRPRTYNLLLGEYGL